VSNALDRPHKTVQAMNGFLDSPVYSPAYHTRYTTNVVDNVVDPLLKLYWWLESMLFYSR